MELFGDCSSKRNKATFWKRYERYNRFNSLFNQKETAVSDESPIIKQPLLKEKQSASQVNPQIKYFLLNIFAILLAIIAIALSMIIWHRLNTAQLEQSLSQMRAELQQTQTQIQHDITTNRNEITQLIYQVGQTASQEVLTETAYLIWLAHIHLIIENNPTLAVQLLKMAQQSLQSLPLNTVFSLTQAINQDITALLVFQKSI